MKFGKNVALMALGAGAVLAYQKYNKPVKNEMEKMVNKTVRKADNFKKNINDKLEDMK